MLRPQVMLPSLQPRTDTFMARRTGTDDNLKGSSQLSYAMFNENDQRPTAVNWADGRNASIERL